MTSPHFQKSNGLVMALSGIIALSVWAHPSGADTVAPTATPSTSPAKPARNDALAYLQLVRVRKRCEQPVTFSVTDASLEDVALRIEKLFNDTGTTPKIHIEVRQAEPVSFSFSAKKSPVSEILGSAANLAGVQLWIFGDHLLLASQKSLSPDEQSLFQKGMVVNAQAQSAPYRNSHDLQWSLAFTNFLADEIKDLKTLPLAQTTKAPPSSISTDKLSDLAKRSAHTLVANATFGQLSPMAQEIAQELFSLGRDNFMAIQTPAFFEIPQVPKLELAPNTPIAIMTGTTERDTQLEMFFPGQDEMMVRINWGMNDVGAGAGSGFGVNFPRPKTPPTPPAATPPLPLDPSAGKS